MIQGRPNHAQRRAGRAGAEHVEGGFAYKIIQEMNEGQIKRGRAVVKGRVRSGTISRQDSLPVMKMPVYRSENGTFYSQCFYRDGRGAKRHKVKRGFATEHEALMWEKDFLAVHNGTMDMLFADFVDVYATEIKPRIREHTWLTKEYMVKDKIIPFFGKMRMSDDQAHRRRSLAEPTHRPQGRQRQAVLGHVPQDHQQPTERHLQPRRALLRPDERRRETK